MTTAGKKKKKIMLAIIYTLNALVVSTCRALHICIQRHNTDLKHDTYDATSYGKCAHMSVCVRAV